MYKMVQQAIRLFSIYIQPLDARMFESMHKQACLYPSTCALSHVHTYTYVSNATNNC